MRGVRSISAIPYDRRSRVGGRRRSRLLLGVATASVFAGVLGLLIAVFAASLFESIGGGGDTAFVTRSLLTPFVYLFEGGLVTAGSGFVLMLGGLVALVSST